MLDIPRFQPNQPGIHCSVKDRPLRMNRRITQRRSYKVVKGLLKSSHSRIEARLARSLGIFYRAINSRVRNEMNYKTAQALLSHGRRRLVLDKGQIIRHVQIHRGSVLDTASLEAFLNCLQCFAGCGNGSLRFEPKGNQHTQKEFRSHGFKV